MSGIVNILPWIVSFLMAAGIVAMQAIGGGGRPMFPLMVCYLPIVSAGLLSIPVILGGNSGRSPDRICLASALAFGAYMLVRSSVGGDHGLRDFELLRIGASALVYLVTVFAVTSTGPRRLFIGILLASAFLQVCVEGYQFYCDQSWFPSLQGLPFLKTYYSGTVGTYANKNHLAWLLGDGALFAVSLACWARIRWVMRGLLLYLFFFLGFGVCISLSRGGVVALMSGLVVLASLSVLLLLLTRDSGKLLAGVLALTIVAAAVAGAFAFFSSNPVLGLRIQGIWMDVYREDLWRASAHDLGNTPFFGMGAGTFQWCARLMMPEESLLAHNDYAQLLSEYGLTGFLLLIVLLAGHLRAGLSTLFRHPSRGRKIGSLSNSRSILLGALSAVSAQLVHSAFDFNTHLASNALIGAFCLGILGVEGLHGRRGQHHVSGVIGSQSIAVMAVVSLTALLVLRDWDREFRFFRLEQILSADSLENRRHPLLQAAADSDHLLSMAPDNNRYADLRLMLHRMLLSRPEAGFSEFADGSVLLGRLQRVLASDQGGWYLRMNQSSILGRFGDEEGGRRAFLQAMVRMPLYAHVYQDHALLLEFQNNPVEALHYGRIATRFKDAWGVDQLIRRLEVKMPLGSGK